MPTPKFTDPWGWTKLDVYRGCPAQFKYKFIEKRKEPPSPALERGTKIHNGLEKFVNGWSADLPEVNKFWVPHLEGLRDQGVKTEAAWGIDKDWKPLANWFVPTTWCRAKSDAYHIEKGSNQLTLIDFKTGRYRVPSNDQIKLYATVGYSMFPYVERVRASFWFTDQAEAPHEEVYKVEDLAKMRGYFNKEVIPLYKDRSFKPKPGDVCRYCNFSRQKNGPCKY
jgi:hypothetical protein